MLLARFAVLGVAAIVCSASCAAAPGEPIGSAVAIKNEVTAAFGSESRRLNKDDPVKQDEIIEVGTDGLGELQFKDDTKLALGPGARMVLDKFVYDPAKSNGSIVVNLIKGTFRFITGVAAKPAYVIKTPTASISVRGTVFDICIRPNGATWVLLIEGSVKMCSDTGSCRVLSEPGKVMRVTLDKKVQAAASWPDLPGKDSTALETAFPFVPLAPSFAPAPALSRDQIFEGRVPPAKQKKKLIKKNR
jgi:hypothetical protein